MYYYIVVGECELQI